MANLRRFNLDSTVRWSVVKSLLVSSAILMFSLTIAIAIVSDMPSGGPSFSGDSMFGAAVLALAIIWPGWVALSSFRTMTNPRGHKVFSRMSQRGLLDQMVEEVENQVREGGHKIGSFIFTPNYLIDTTHVAVERYSELVWIYKKQTRHSVNFIPTGSTYEVVIHSNDGAQRMTAGSLKVVDQVLGTLAQNCPWIVTGYSAQLVDLWNRSRGDFVAEVEARFQAHQATT